MNILITGGAGFIGCNIAARYLKEGHQVTLFDNFSRSQVEKNVDFLKSLNSANLNVIKADVRNFDSLVEPVKNAQLIYHCAGQTAVTTSIKDPRTDFETNSLGTFNVLEAIRLHNHETPVIYTSTNKVYGALGQHQTQLKDNRYVLTDASTISESEPLQFYSPYGCSKGSGDQYMLDYARIYHLKTIVFRQSCIYGEHQFGVEDQGWVAHFVMQALKQQPITIFGDGHQVRDLLYIEDLLNAYQASLKNLTTTAGQVYNIGGGAQNATSLLEIIDQINLRSDLHVKVKFANLRSGDQLYYVSNTTRAQNDFGWQPTTTIETGLDKLFNWLKANLP